MDVRDALLEAQKTRARLELEPLTPTSKLGTVLRTSVEQVQRDAFDVGQPTADGKPRQLARYEPYRISFLLDRGRIIGQTEAQGRVKIPAGGGQTLYGYRLAFPATLHAIDLRREMRLLLGNDLVREAKLQLLGRAGPVMGLVKDISATGASLICRNADEHVRRSQQAHFKLDLPEPIGELREMVTIVGVEPDPQSDGVLVRIVFQKKVQAMVDVLNNNQRRGHPRRRSA